MDSVNVHDVHQAETNCFLTTFFICLLCTRTGFKRKEKRENTFGEEKCGAVGL